MTTPRDWADIPPPAADGDPWVCQRIATTPRAMRGVLVGLAAAVPVWGVVVSVRPGSEGERRKNRDLRSPCNQVVRGGHPQETGR
jgi:hypothetical protein